jgi:tetratricopeptide (TPR) repeat protein
MVGLMDRAFYHRQAAVMARTQASYLLSNTIDLPAEMVVTQAVRLVRDCVHYLNIPALAVEVALGLHLVVERWTAWTAWSEALDTLLHLSQDAYPISDRIHLLHNRNHAACEVGDVATAILSAKTALQLAEAHDDKVLIALSLHELALAEYHRDDLVPAQQHWRHAYRLGCALLPPVKIGHMCMNLGLIAVAQGQFEEAYQRYAQAQHYYHSVNDGVHVAKVQCNIASVQRREGRWADAIRTLQAACTTLREADAPYAYALAENDLGYTYLASSNFDYALSAFHTAMHVFDKVRSLDGQALVLSNIAELYVTTAQWQQAEATLQDARELAVLCGRPLLIAAIDVDRGRMYAAQGEYDTARQLWQDGLAVQVAKGALYEVQQTRQLLNTLPG